jgi:hypothetical protein
MNRGSNNGRCEGRGCLKIIEPFGRWELH